jgi:DnaK suppressor protein
MLTDTQRSTLKDTLEQEKLRLLKNAQEVLSFSMNRERNIGRDSIDESMEEEIFSTELRLRDREKFLLSKVEGALKRVDDNTVDECEDCGETIGYKRLLARPVTTLCIDCKESREKEESSTAQPGRPGGSSLPSDDGDSAGDAHEAE